MGLTVEGYPEPCRKNLRTILGAVNADPQTIYAMMLMTALLMDLHPEDDEVMRIILQDCGVRDGVSG